jgi:hypothetical protein
MPSTLTYPGVYIEEIPSGVRTIVGVATSITAFIGRASRGPVKDPTVVFSFGDFERLFGGLGLAYPMSYAVRDFFVNGGSQALILRLFTGVGNGGGGDGIARFTVDTLKLAAASPGTWGANLRAAIDINVADDVRADMGLPPTAFLFNLTVQDSGPGGATERFFNLTIVPSPRRIDRVLEAQSNLVRWDGIWKDTRPTDMPLVKVAVDAQKALATAQAAQPPVPATIAAAMTAPRHRTICAVRVSKPMPACRRAGGKAAKAGGHHRCQAALTIATDAMHASGGVGLDDAAWIEGGQDGPLRSTRPSVRPAVHSPDGRANSGHDDTSSAVYQAALAYCRSPRDAHRRFAGGLEC